MHHRLLAQLVGGPGHPPAMVAVGGGEEDRLAELVLQLLAGQVVVGHLGHVPAQGLSDVVGHGKGAAQHLEGVQPKPVALVLYVQPLQPQLLGHAPQLRQGRLAVLRKALVECPGLGYLVQPHHRQLGVLRLGHAVGGPLDLIHESTSKIILMPKK